MNRLAPVSEAPINEDCSKKTHTWRNWFRNYLQLSHKKSDLKILLSVVASPLFPVAVDVARSPISEVSSSAQYIIQHYVAATGCRKLEGVVKNMYASGKVGMAMVDDLAKPVWQKGCFVIWQMLPHKWLVELVVAGHKVVAGSDGNVAWRHTPWLGPHAAKGAVRPLRRLLQGLDPAAISSVFSTAQYAGEKNLHGVDCFLLKLSAEHSDLADRSDNSAEMIKHITLGYFSQRSGLLVYLEDSYLTRIQAPGSHPAYWETTMYTKIEDYRDVEGMMIAHSGQSSVVIARFGENMKGGQGVTRMEETYMIDDVAFNVPGVSIDSFIPPREIQQDCHPEQNGEWRFSVDQ